MQTEAKETRANYQIKLERNLRRQYYTEFPGSQWLGRCAITAEGMHSIPGQGTTIPCITDKTTKTNENKKMKQPHRFSTARH